MKDKEKTRTKKEHAQINDIQYNESFKLAARSLCILSSLSDLVGILIDGDNYTRLSNKAKELYPQIADIIHKDVFQNIVDQSKNFYQFEKRVNENTIKIIEGEYIGESINIRTKKDAITIENYLNELLKVVCFDSNISIIKKLLSNNELKKKITVLENITYTQIEEFNKIYMLTNEKVESLEKNKTLYQFEVYQYCFENCKNFNYIIDVLLYFKSVFSNNNTSTELFENKVIHDLNYKKDKENYLNSLIKQKEEILILWEKWIRSKSVESFNNVRIYIDTVKREITFLKDMLSEYTPVDGRTTTTETLPGKQKDKSFNLDAYLRNYFTGLSDDRFSELKELFIKANGKVFSLSDKSGLPKFKESLSFTHDKYKGMVSIKEFRLAYLFNSILENYGFIKRKPKGDGETENYDFVKNNFTYSIDDKDKIEHNIKAAFGNNKSELNKYRDILEKYIYNS